MIFYFLLEGKLIWWSTHRFYFIHSSTSNTRLIRGTPEIHVWCMNDPIPVKMGNWDQTMSLKEDRMSPLNRFPCKNYQGLATQRHQHEGEQCWTRNIQGIELRVLFYRSHLTWGLLYAHSPIPWGGSPCNLCFASLTVANKDKTKIAYCKFFF